MATATKITPNIKHKQQPASPGTGQPSKPAYRELTEVQEAICDQIADILISGAPSDETKAVALAAARHLHRNYWTAGLTSQKIEERAVECAEEWAADLIVSQKRRRKGPEREWPKPENVVDRIRLAVLQELKGQFDEFLRSANPEDCRLMQAILMDYGCNAVLGPDRGEVTLGHAFEFQLGRHHCYVRVPGKFLDQVQKYVAALWEIEDAKTVA